MIISSMHLPRKASGWTAPVTLLELGPNSGVFANYDELDTSNIVIADAARGTSATIVWDDTGIHCSSWI